MADRSNSANIELPMPPVSWIGEAQRRQFAEDGYMVIRGVVPWNLTVTAVLEIAEFAGVDLRDSHTWYSGPEENDSVVPMHHSQALWNIRQCPELYAVFCEFWGTHQLMVDINRCYFRPPCRRDFPTRSRSGIHWDTDPRAPGPGSIQAVVLLTDVGLNAGGYQCQPDIYRNLKAWLAEHAKQPDFDFFNPGLNQHPATQIEGCAGDLIIWSSRLPHGSAANLSAEPRFAMFVTMQPLSESMDKRRETTDCWRAKRAPPHWRGMRGQLDVEPGPPAELTELGLHLVGAHTWDPAE